MRLVRSAPLASTCQCSVECFLRMTCCHEPPAISSVVCVLVHHPIMLFQHHPPNATMPLPWHKHTLRSVPLLSQEYSPSVHASLFLVALALQVTRVRHVRCSAQCEGISASSSRVPNAPKKSALQSEHTALSSSSLLQDSAICRYGI